MSTGSRTPEQIRQDIERTRHELAHSVESLRGRVTELTDWRRHLRENRETILIGAAVTGFVIGGGWAALRGYRRRRRG